MKPWPVFSGRLDVLPDGNLPGSGQATLGFAGLTLTASPKTPRRRRWLLPFSLDKGRGAKMDVEEA